MQESSLHAALKVQLSKPGDQIEIPVDGFVIDIRHGEQLIEIQTGNFSALKSKLLALLEKYPVCVVHPIPSEKWIIREFDQDATSIKKRKSPKHGRVEQLFYEIVRFPHLAAHPNFSLMILLTKEEEIRNNDGRGSWRRKGWSIKDRRLLEIVKCYLFQSPNDYLCLLPENLQTPFTTRQLASRLSITYNLATKMVYCLRKMKLIERDGKIDRSFIFRIISQ